LESSHFALIDCDISSWRDAEVAGGIISLFESARTLTRMDCAKASDGIRNRRDAGLRLSERTIEEARRSAAVFCQDMTRALDAADADAFISPTWPFAAPPIDAQSVSIRGETISVDPRRNCFVRAANAAGATALTLPMGLYPDAQAPAGIHLMTAHGRDYRLLAVAARVEHAMPRLPLPPPLREVALSAQAPAVDRRSSTTP
jgi:Asp-tRNA(Asn)/Glu-tRNA(Gln) amidotransferase A subunit family amidase